MRVSGILLIFNHIQENIVEQFSVPMNYLWYNDSVDYYTFQGTLQ